MTDSHRGHAVIMVNGIGVYADTGQLVSSNPDRACGYCGLPNTPEGHDGCLGTLSGVRNACCGHGGSCRAYVMLKVLRPEGRKCSNCGLRQAEA